MKTFFKSSVAQFAVFVLVVLTYSVVTGISFETVFEQALDQRSATPTTSPVQQNFPDIKGAQVSTESAELVSEVIDGDTIRLSSGETVRYIGIDTPETKHPRVEKECYGEEASRYNEELVLGKMVQLESDVTDRDRYGRLLRYVWVDGVLINQTLVAAGYAEAIAYPPDIKYQSVLEKSEQEARENKRGLWSVCESLN